MLTPLVEKDRRWPSGDCVDLALLDVPECALETTFGVPFVRGAEDGLGEWVASGGRLPSGIVVELVRYVDAPTPGVNVRVGAAVDLRNALDEILMTASLPAEAVLWTSARVDA